ncbi:hypothetical protein GDO78_012015 [Eleutherodactylus coqui]|uniref:Uncharacterized protein n=1 Tax=Eleutherodactylus coqui TaxID=57060 RepID=A0A8J6F4Q7_ELECQ|nr:hypothetical protein GDO78_012015 [Eleutherodactylus coqui]
MKIHSAGMPATGMKEKCSYYLLKIKLLCVLEFTSVCRTPLSHISLQSLDVLSTPPNPSVLHSAAFIQSHIIAQKPRRLFHQNILLHRWSA